MADGLSFRQVLQKVYDSDSDTLRLDGDVGIVDQSDLAQETTLDGFRTDFGSEDFASETTLDAMKTVIETDGLPAATRETTHHLNEGSDVNGEVANIGGYGPTGFQVSGVTGTATVEIEVSQDETEWDVQESINATGFTFLDLAGAKYVRARIDGSDADTDLTVKSFAVGVAIPENVTIGTEPAGSDTFEHGEQDVSTAGTSVQLPDIACREVTITAKRDNTGTIYVGGTSVSSTSYGTYLNAGDSLTKPVENANLIHIDADEGGDGVVFCYV